MDEQKLDRKNEPYIDLSRLIQEFWPVLRRLYWLPLALALFIGGFGLIRSVRTYTPLYASEVTFTIQVVSSSTSDFSSASSYYDKSTAEQLGKTFPYLVQSDLFAAELRQALGVDYINGVITAKTVPDTNLFTMRVSSPSAQDALRILKAVIEIYPQVADYVIGSTSMDLLTQPVEASAPYNPLHPLRSACRGAALGVLFGLIFLLLIASLRRTIRTAKDAQLKLNQICLTTLPIVSFKRRSAPTEKLLSIHNDHVSSAYQEGIRTLRIKLLRLLSDTNNKIILVTSTMPGEGKTTASVNLAQSLSANGAKVILIDADLRKPSVKRALGITAPSQGLMDALELEDQAAVSALLTPVQDSLWLLAGDTGSPRTHISLSKLRHLLGGLREQADYIILDTPPCGLLADSANMARAADCILYILGAGAVPVPQILDSIQSLSEAGTPILGCVLNGAAGTHSGYGYSYGYGYGYGGYGRKKQHRADNAEVL